MNIFKDIYNFINSLSFVDIVFLGAVIALLILIVTLIYFIKINKDEVLEKSILDNNIKSDNKKDDLVDLIIKENTEVVKEEEEYNDEEGELLDLESLTEKLKNEEKTDQVKIDKYEQEQEEKAIISYDELLSKKNHYAINYEKEEQLDDITVKKVNLSDLVNKNVEDNSKNIVQVISYQKEEDFLRALKELNSLLN